MDLGELVYDPRGVYSRSYVCPQCNTIFETFLDKKGDHIKNLDTWWKTTVSNEKKTIAKESNQDIVKQSAVNRAGPPKTGVPQTTEPPKKINLAEMPVTYLSNKPASANKKVPVTVSPDLRQRKNVEKKNTSTKNANSFRIS
jgi:hypothetical protein